MFSRQKLNRFSVLLQTALDNWDWFISYWDAPRDSYIEFEALTKEIVTYLSEQRPADKPN